MDITIISACKGCGFTDTQYAVYDKNTGDYICSNCGATIFDDIPEFPRTPVKTGSTYNRCNHINQIIKAWSRDCDPLQTDVVNAIVPSALHFKAWLFQNTSEPNKIKSFKSFTKKHVCMLLRSVKLPLRLQYKYKSQRGRVMTTVAKRKQYTMRWWLFKDALIKTCEDSNYEPEKPDPELVMLISAAVKMIVKPFNRHRHDHECDYVFYTMKCGDPKCRFAMLNAYFIILNIIKILDPTEATYHKWKNDFPQLCHNKTVQLNQIWEKVTSELGWPTSLRRSLKVMFPHFERPLKWKDA